MLDELDYEKERCYIMDKEYIDFARLHKLHASGVYFVTRAKANRDSVECIHAKSIKRPE